MPCKASDGSPQNILLVTQCLEKSLDLLLGLRAQAPLPGSQPVTDPDSRQECADSDTDFEVDSDSVFDFDSELKDDQMADLSNEWPVVPRGRSVDQPEGDDGRTATGKESLPDRWRGRLVMDMSLSETSPVIKGTWVTVSQVVSLVVDGWSWADILRAHPELSDDDIRTCLAYTVAEDDGEL